MAAVSEELRKLLEKQGYGFSGKHSAVKICTWTKKSLIDEGVCYKEQFYGIKSHLCAEVSSTIGYCQNRCMICWRPVEHTVGIEMKEDVDDPVEIIDNWIEQRNKLINGFPGNPKVNMKKWEEAQEPMHFAISLSGEPLIYPKLNELIKELHKRGKTTYVVTNGMLPERLKELELPTQLYVSIDAPNKELFEKIDKCVLKDGWERLLKSLDVVKNLKGKVKRVLRITLVKGMNMVDVESYAELIKKADPDYVEVKAYMHVGGSKERLAIENMPRHEDVKEFADSIAKESGLKVVDQKMESRVCLLAQDGQHTKAE